MNELGQLSIAITKSHQELKSWRKVAAPYGINAAMARMVANGYQPGKKIRKLLDLRETSTVMVMFGDVPPGTQVVSALQCECGQWFIPNSPNRKRCFICSPYRKHPKKEKI